MTEAELIARAKAGDPGAFEQLVLDNQNRVYSLALRMLGDPEDAQDAAQEAFLNAWRALPTFKGESSFSTWVYRLTSNACIDHLRRRKRRLRLPAAGPQAHHRVHGEDLYALHLLRRSAAAGGQAPRQQQ